MLPDDRQGVAVSEAPANVFAERSLAEQLLAERGSDEFPVPSGPDDTAELGGHGDDEREWFGRHPAYPRNTPEHLHTPDLQTRFYVGLWLPGAGALLAYGVLRGNYWAAFVGIELLLVGWFTLAKL